MSDVVLSASEAFRRSLAGFDARRYVGDDAARVAADLARTEKIVAAARLQAMTRATECGAHRDRGFSNPAEWVARETGESAGKARAELELAVNLGDNPDLKAAVESGDVSLQEGVEVAKTEAECPGSTPDMLREAKRRSLRGVKEQGRRKRQEAKDPDELAAKRRKARHLRTWDGDLGMVCGQFALEPQHDVPFLKRLQAEVDREQALRGCECEH